MSRIICNNFVPGI